MTALLHACGDDGHLVDLLGVAAPGEIVDGGVEALEDGAVGLVAAQALGDLIADVARLDVGEYEGVGVAGHLAARELQLAHRGGHGGVELHLAVNGELRGQLLGRLGGGGGQGNRRTLAGALGGEAEHGNLGRNAEELGGAGGLHGHLRQLLRGGHGDVALLVHAVLIGDVDGAVAHAQHPQGLVPGVPLHDEAGGDQVRAGLGLDELECRTDGVGGGVGGAAQQGVGLAQLHQHGAEVVALLEGGAALVLAHLALAQLHHLGHHLVHAGVGGGVNDLRPGDVEAVLLRRGLDLLHIAHQDHVHQILLQQPGGGLQNAGVGSLGEHDGAAVLLQILQKTGKHGLLPPFFCSVLCAGPGPAPSNPIIHLTGPGLNAILQKIFVFWKQLAILEQLRSGEKCACVLLGPMDLTQSRLSCRVIILCDSRLAASWQEGKWTHYCLCEAGREENA